MNSKRIALIGGGQWQKPLAAYIVQNFGFLIVVDPNETSDVIEMADVHIRIDISEIDGIKLAFKDIEVDYFVSDQSDLGIEVATELNERFGLQGIGVAVMKKFCKKDISRKFANAIGVNVPVSYACSDFDGYQKILSNVSFDCIVKPSDAQSSRGISIVSNDGKPLSTEPFEFAKVNSRSGIVVVEELIRGIELTAEGICNNGEHTTCAISSKKHFRTAIASELRYPADLPNDVIAHVKESNDLYVNASGLQHGITHAEYMYNPQNNKIYLIEFACRGGGSLISSHIIQWFGGFDPHDYLFPSFGQKKPNPVVQQTTRTALLKFVEYPAGEVKEILGLDEIKKLPCMTYIDFGIKVGSIIAEAKDDRSRQGFFLLLAENAEELKYAETMIDNDLKVLI